MDNTQNERIRVLLSLSLLVGGLCGGFVIRQGLPFPLPSIKQAQTILGCKDIDGKLGPCWRDSETQRRWELYQDGFDPDGADYCEQSARIYINEHTMKE